MVISFQLKYDSKLIICKKFNSLNKLEEYKKQNHSKRIHLGVSFGNVETN